MPRSPKNGTRPENALPGSGLDWIKHHQIKRDENGDPSHSVWGEVPLEEALPTLASSHRLLKKLAAEYGDEVARIVDMMRAGRFDGDAGDSLHDYLVEHLGNDSEPVWEALCCDSEDEWDHYPIVIREYHGIYIASAQEFDDKGYFLSFELALQYVESNWTSLRVQMDVHSKGEAARPKT